MLKIAVIYAFLHKLCKIENVLTIKRLHFDLQNECES